MKIIDAHIHFSDVQSFRNTAKNVSNVDYSSKGLNKELNECGIVAGIGMGLEETKPNHFPDYTTKNPMLLNLETEVPHNVYTCIGINPIELKKDKKSELYKIEKQLNCKTTVGIKIYSGYYPFYVYDEIYNEVYNLAEYFNIPVVIHSGDTYSQRGLLKYAQPLSIDELAVRFRKVNFIVAHFGDPWVMDTAEIVLKNSNVYADLSGLIIGDFSNVNKFSNEKLFIEHIKRGIIYADSYEKILFGSDWPLVQISPYINFIKQLIPQKHYDDVFYNNAIKLFTKLKNT